MGRSSSIRASSKKRAAAEATEGSESLPPYDSYIGYGQTTLPVHSKVRNIATIVAIYTN